MTIRDPQILEQRLDDFDPAVRRDALAALTVLWDRGFTTVGTNVNMHCHSFFSFNSHGYSPTRIAWEARKRGLYAAALCDFDVLDGLDEFLGAGRDIGLRTAVHLETRVFDDQAADKVINSPGEPGVAYMMGAGFFSHPPAGAPEAARLKAFRDAARDRNIALINRVNERIEPVRVSYEREVLPLTPSGVATERHIVRAYIDKVGRVLPNDAQRKAFWAKLLNRRQADVAKMMLDAPAFEDAVRSVLAKRGGIGYEAPSPTTFPPAQTFIKWVRACDAIPTITWLDGTSEGESDARELLERLCGMGCAALNIIPDRNWNVRATAEKRLKVKNLDAIVKEAVRLNLPVNIGTEMNRPGLPFADDLGGPALLRHRAVFLEGARIMVGHTLLGRYADMPYLSKAATAAFPDQRQRNAFFAAVGGMPPLNHDLANRLLDYGPERAFTEIRERVATVPIS